MLFLNSSTPDGLLAGIRHFRTRIENCLADLLNFKQKSIDNQWYQPISTDQENALNTGFDNCLTESAYIRNVHRLNPCEL